MNRAPCVAMTNSDRVHGGQVQAQLGFQLSHWICAEEIRCYKPSAEFWRATASRLGRALDKSWCHVSAYGDYDLGGARQLGLATAFISRPHCRPAPADVNASDLMSLFRLLK
jgi:FMN phosphatase YigB (HAD superfamily)